MVLVAVLLAVRGHVGCGIHHHVVLVTFLEHEWTASLWWHTAATRQRERETKMDGKTQRSADDPQGRLDAFHSRQPLGKLPKLDSALRGVEGQQCGCILCGPREQLKRMCSTRIPSAWPILPRAMCWQWGRPPPPPPPSLLSSSPIKSCRGRIQQGPDSPGR